MRVLHMIRSLDDERALSTARAHAGLHDTSVLLLQDAVLTRVQDFPGRVYACAEDVEARVRLGGAEEIDYPAIVRLLVDADKVIAW